MFTRFQSHQFPYRLQNNRFLKQAPLVKIPQNLARNSRNNPEGTIQLFFIKQETSKRLLLPLLDRNPHLAEH